MTHPNQDNHSLLNQVVNHLCTEGCDGMAEAIRLLLNHAMQAERSKALGAAPYERSTTRKGHANGFKPGGNFRDEVPPGFGHAHILVPVSTLHHPALQA